MGRRRLWLREGECEVGRREVCEVGRRRLWLREGECEVGRREGM